MRSELAERVPIDELNEINRNNAKKSQTRIGTAVVLKNVDELIEEKD